MRSRTSSRLRFAVLRHRRPGPRHQATVFDSTGLAVQDLAIALAAMERAEELDLSTIEL